LVNIYSGSFRDKLQRVYAEGNIQFILVLLSVF